jgi:UPF0176 protein
MALYNRINRDLLKSRLANEHFSRKTLSFYRYFVLEDPDALRDALYKEWFDLNCFGRIYIAREGVNAQLSVPEYNLDTFYQSLKNYAIFDQISIKYAIEDNGKSFYKLTIKVRPKLVADGLSDDAFDVTNVGTHLSAEEFHKLVESKDTIVVDMRNHYESEIGHFKNAVCPQTDTFREEITSVVDMLADKKDQKILLYCTGGIRCEKASAYLKHHGFQDVNQLHGGILEYARRIKQLNLTSNFIGKNFVFDERMGETVSDDVISHCHQCGKPCDIHVNCANNLCHILFIQCKECEEKFDNCCSSECCVVKNGNEAEKLEFQQRSNRKFGNKTCYRKSFALVNKDLFLASNLSEQQNR